MEFSYELKVPKDRIAVLIGTKGSTKRKIEQITHAKIDIDSDEGDVILSGTDSLGLFTAREVIRAIARGFNPEIALLVLKPEYSLEIINMQDFIGKSKKSLERVRARVIGTEGKTRKFIEDATETYIVIYGKTIGIIGEIEKVTLARQAIETLLTGSPHAGVYRWLDKKRKEMRRDEVSL
ncbi:RNA-processing protein [Candidatus Woesearchaeota archaeon]|nr:MAG: RNA-processing protein [Candidatus Woesearchaeota archaeon]